MSSSPARLTIISVLESIVCKEFARFAGASRGLVPFSVHRPILDFFRQRALIKAMELPLNQIIQGDCLEILKTFPDKSVDLVLTDPPYGIGEDGGRFRDRKGGGHRVLPKGNWDRERPSKNYFDEMLRVSKNQIIFGGNYFTDYLYPSRGWIYWGKKMGGDFSDGELAWTSFDRTLKEFQFCNKFGGKEHPTQKPTELMRWILQNYSSDSDLILDPFLGSGTSAVAAKMEGRNYIGIELSEKYCEIARRRVASAPTPLFASAKLAA